MTNAEAIEMIQNDIKLHHDYLSGKYRKALKKAIKALEAQEWILCSERLPKYEEEVIVSVRDDSGDSTLDYSSCGWYACAGDFWVVDNEPNPYVIAWMPLPEPYRAERRTDD